MTSDIPPTLRMASESPDQPRDTGSAGPGRTIRQARERARLSLEELAKETRLARGTLEALERDDFSTLTEPVYVRGYYRKCAKVLNLPENELISSYDKLFAPKTPTIPTKLLLSNSETMSPTGRRGGSGGIIAIVLVVAVLTGGIWFVTHDPSRFGFGDAASTGTAEAVAATPAPTPITLPPPSPINPAAITTTSSGATSPTTTTEAPAPAAALNLDATLNPPTGPAAATADPATSPAASPGSASLPAPSATLTTSTALTSPTSAAPTSTAAAPASGATVATAAASSGSLVLSFKSSSWVRIEDADGRLLLSGTIQAGDRQQLSGRAPYALFLGYAPGVSVEFNGKPIDTTPYVRQNSTARISVPLPPNPVPATATQ